MSARALITHHVDCWTYHPKCAVVYAAGLHERIAELEARVTELQNANTREIKRRRAAEQALREAREG